MKIKILTTLSIVALFLTPSGFAQKKLAQTGMKFLQVSLDAKMAGMGDAATALDNLGVNGLFSNPASIARQTNLIDATTGQVNWIADIKYYAGGVTFAPENGQYGVLGVSFLYVNYGDFISTVRNNQGYVETGIFNPNAYAIGLTYGKALNDKFSIGGSVKYALQNLTSGIVDITDAVLTQTNYKPNSLVFDFGVLYHTGIQSLDFAASIKNFSKDIQLEREQEKFQLPLTFRVGFAYNLSDMLQIDKNDYSIQLAFDSVVPRDNVEEVDLGVEFKFMNSFALRGGYLSGKEGEYNLTYGLGFGKAIEGFYVGLDYAYIPWNSDSFSDIHKFSIHFGI
ncbi:MAG: DUF3308 domain-containing protein [Ignavibacteria bacterium CG22_combo_CG10-13_8_21_14_all_37_15]|nr:MAG: DUF3308 domain-containing protein [Ignavibacteria bacterium CG22_combo_CG10-13_8_21_14_all_37_15]